VAYLESAEPDIETGAARCIARGVEEVDLLPCFLSAGHHVRDDLEPLRKKLATRYSKVRWRMCEAIGRHPLLVEILLQRLNSSNE
jgi:sirohydrochlorin ferrochelatase